MRYIFYCILTLLLTTQAFGQKKIILTKGLDRVVLVKNKEVGITTFGHEYIFDSCKNICKPCNKTISDNFWTIDSIKQNYIKLKKIKSLKYLTLTYEDFRHQKRKLYKDEGYERCDSTVIIDSILYWVLKKPSEYWTKSIMYDSISTYTFSLSQNCDRGENLYLFFLLPTLAYYGTALELSNDHINTGRLIFAISSAVLFTWDLVFYINSYKIKKYDTDKWKIKIK